jgi:hypothetical protein
MCTTLPPLPDDALLANQENIVPIPDFSDPPCVAERHVHPHQFVAITTLWKEEWRPYHEVKLEKPIDFPLLEDLINQPPQFPMVTPFCSKSTHIQCIHPRNQPLAHILEIPQVAICSKAIVTPPCADFPLGHIKYNFANSIINTFAKYTPTIQGAFTNSLTVLEVINLLDGRQIMTYGYLRFEGTNVFLSDQTYHCEDYIRTYPQLLAYTFTPCIPADPFIYLKVQ